MSPSKKDLLREYCKTKKPELKKKLILSHLNLVEYIAKKFAFRRDDLEDLIQVGTIGLIKALERYDLKHEVEFTTYATPNIIGEIKHYFRDKSRLVKVPRKLHELNSRVKTFIREYVREHGQSPTISTIALSVDSTEEEILESMEAGQTYETVSLDAPLYQTEKESTSTTPISLIDSLGIGAKDEIVLDKECLMQAIASLNRREQKIIYLRFYDNLTQAEIANLLDMSQMHVSRLLVFTLKKLSKALKK